MARDHLSRLFSWRGAIADADLPGIVKCTAYALSLHMSERGDSCFPSYETLAHEAGFGRSTVIRATAQLVDLGWLEKKKRRGSSNIYRAVVPEREIEAAAIREVVSERDGGSVRAGLGGPGAGRESVTESVTESDIKHSANGAGNWIAPFWDLWAKEIGEPPKSLLKVCSELRKSHPDEWDGGLILESFTNYLEETSPKFLGGAGAPVTWKAKWRAFTNNGAHYQREARDSDLMRGL